MLGERARAEEVVAGERGRQFEEHLRAGGSVSACRWRGPRLENALSSSVRAWINALSWSNSFCIRARGSGYSQELSTSRRCCRSPKMT
jgi:hypothetical protein